MALPQDGKITFCSQFCDAGASVGIQVVLSLCLGHMMQLPDSHPVLCAALASADTDSTTQYIFLRRSRGRWNPRLTSVREHVQISGNKLISSRK